MNLTKDSWYWYRHGPRSDWQVIYVDRSGDVWLTGLSNWTPVKAIETGELGPKVEPPTNTGDEK